MLWDKVLIEHKQPVDVMLCLLVALEGFSRKAGATDIAYNTPTLHCYHLPCVLCGVLLLCLSNLYPPSRHGMTFVLATCPKAYAFEKGDKDGEQIL